MKIMTIIREFIGFFNYFCMAYSLILAVIYLFQLFKSMHIIRKKARMKELDDYENYVDSQNLPPITLVVPAYNEEANIVGNVKDLLNTNYPNFEVVVVNDGSSDGTHSKMIEAFNLYRIQQSNKVALETKKVNGIYYNLHYPNLYYIDKDNGGKSDAINSGINYSSYPLFACLDADSRIEKNALLILGEKFLRDSTTVVAGGYVRIANGTIIKNGEWEGFELPSKAVEKFQIVEYYRSFLAGRVSWGNALLIVSGAFGVFDKKIVIECGGYKNDTIGEDMEIVVKIHENMLRNKRKYKVEFVHEAICWTQGPMSISDLRKQRRRWQIGLFDTLKSYILMTFNPRYKLVGMISIPYNWLFEYLGTVVETLGFIIIPFSLLMGELNPYFFCVYLIISMMLGILLSVGGIILEQYTRKGCMTTRQAMSLALYAVLENFGYRQLITLFRFEGIISFKKRKKQWGSIERKKFNS